MGLEPACLFPCDTAFQVGQVGAFGSLAAADVGDGCMGFRGGVEVGIDLPYRCRIGAQILGNPVDGGFGCGLCEFIHGAGVHGEERAFRLLVAQPEGRQAQLHRHLPV